MTKATSYDILITEQRKREMRCTPLIWLHQKTYAEKERTARMGAHKTVILKMTIMASVRQGWERNNGYLVKAGYPLFFCLHEKQWIYSQLSGIIALNQSYPIHSEIFSKNLKKV